MPQAAAPMPPNQPTAPPGPLNLGDFFSSTFATFRAAWKVYLSLAVTPVLIITGGVVLMIMAYVTSLAYLIVKTRDWHLSMASLLTDFLGVLVGFTIISIIFTLLIALFSNVFVGRIMVAALDCATGRAVPTWANLAGRTRGLLGRTAQYMLIVAGIVIGAFVAVTLVVLLLSTLFRQSAGLGALLIFTTFFASALATLWFTLNLIYTPLVLAEEGLAGMAAVKRSFALVKGAFWRTFGYAIVLYLSGAIANTLFAPLARSDNAVVLFFGSLLPLAFTLVFIPLSSIWVSLMYLGRVRELTNPMNGYPVGPPPGTPWADQGQPFGQSPGQYTNGSYPPPQPHPGPADPGPPAGYGQPETPEQPGCDHPFAPPRH